MDVKIEETWKAVLQEEFNKPYFEILTNFVRKEYQTTTIYPPAKLIFNAFNLCPFDQAKVVIIGQDPYHGPGQAHGLCFSVNDGVAYPPSLVNIFKEIEDDLHRPTPASGNLERWAKQGVLLLNAILTVRANQPASHQNKGWEEFTDRVIKELSDKRDGLVFMLWGSYAQKKGAVIDTKKHLVLKTVHPSPLSAYRGFFGCKHFSQANAYLQSRGKSPIEW
ncbi:MAG: uracil-DNA glycosylase [Paludibacteraceae bacterium]|nr:uracil-DNA glycosylase [Paludibacteraceae bacterium]